MRITPQYSLICPGHIFS